MATPTLVQMVASASNPAGGADSGDAFKFFLPNAVGAHNDLLMFMSYPHGATPTVTDNNGNTWPASPDVSADAGVGNLVAAAFNLKNANAGITQITISFGASQQPFQYTVMEWTNVDTSSPVNGTIGAANVAAPNLATGTFTPTSNNDANGGNVVVAYFAIKGLAAGNPSSFSAGGSFILLDADIGWTDTHGFPHSSQSFVQTTQGTINPAVTATGDTQGYNCLAIAL